MKITVWTTSQRLVDLLSQEDREILEKAKEFWSYTLNFQVIQENSSTLSRPSEITKEIYIENIKEASVAYSYPANNWTFQYDNLLTINIVWSEDNIDVRLLITSK